jgi:tetratricopeptide (TPR) repeat protein
MAKLGVVLVALLSVCPAGHAEDSPDLSSLVFTPRTVSSPPLSIVSGDNAPAVGNAAETSRSLRTPGSHDDATRSELTASIEERLDAVSKEQAENGERSLGLIDRLTSLAAAYQELGEYDSAIAALQDARNIVRVNSGLYSLDQAPIVESLIANDEAKGEYAEAAKQRKYLRELVRANADDARIVGVLTGLARSEMDSARRLLDVPAPSVLIVNTGPIGPADAPLPSPMLRPSMGPQKPSLRALYGARSDYVDAIRATARMHGDNVPDLFALEDALADTVYFEFAHPELHGQHRLYAATRVYAPPPILPGEGPVPLGMAGAQILGDRVQDSINFGLAPTAVAQALIELGDWLLAYAQNGAALSEYQSAHDVLVKGKVPAETIGAMLSPEMPPIIPILPAAVAGGGGQGPYRGYIDVSIKITRFGDAKDIDVLDVSPGTSKVIERHLRRYVSSSRFRPRFVDGEPARSDKFTARFYYGYR